MAVAAKPERGLPSRERTAPSMPLASVAPAKWSSPKLPSAIDRAASIFHYYAGYSTDFVADVLNELAGSETRVLDPWNGAGATTHTSAIRGIPVTGIDLNPVMTIIARVRSARRRDLLGMSSSACEVLTVAQDSRSERTMGVPDPLEQWFDLTSASHLRTIADAIATTNLAERSVEAEVQGPALSLKAACLYVALFQTVRRFVAPLIGTNPTWVRKADPHELVHVSNAVIRTSFEDSVRSLLGTLEVHVGVPDTFNPPNIMVASSCALPVAEDSVDLVVTSPPYCTRLDYAVATRAELAVLGVTSDEFRALRENLLGTTAIATSVTDLDETWAPGIEALLGSVEAHPSKDSRSYYLKHYRQYFRGIAASLCELQRVVVSGGRLLMVVQDSYYKEIHIDLPKLLSEIACASGWALDRRIDHRAPRNVATMNPGSRKYRSAFEATEAVLLLTRMG